MSTRKIKFSRYFPAALILDLYHNEAVRNEQFSSFFNLKKICLQEHEDRHRKSCYIKPNETVFYEAFAFLQYKKTDPGSSLASLILRQLFIDREKNAHHQIYPNAHF